MKFDIVSFLAANQGHPQVRQATPDALSESVNQGFCRDFYQGLGGRRNRASVELVNGGAQSAIWRCQTTDDLEPNPVAIKSYYDLSAMNLTEITKIDAALSDQGVRIPVYAQTEMGKIEFFLDGYRDFQETGQEYADEAVYSTIATKMARLHMATVDDIPDDKYRQYAPANPDLFIPANSQPLVWWNTFLIREHFVQLRGLFEAVANGIFPIPGISIESADDWIQQIEQEVRETIPDFSVTEEIEYVAQLVENYYKSNDEGPVMCHNDLHLGNIMRNAEGDFDPNRLVFVDFDLAAYGARAFDINYHTSYWLPDWDTKMDFLKIYHDEIERQHLMNPNMTLRDGHLEDHDDHDDHDHDEHNHDHDHDDDFYDLDTIARDVMAHDPYVLLEQMMFRWMFLGNGTTAAERQNDAVGDPTNFFEQLADQKKWLPIRYLEAKERAEQNLCIYTKDASTKDCSKDSSASANILSFTLISFFTALFK